MTWSAIIAAAVGRPKALDEVIRRSRDDDVAALTTLLLLDDAPHPAAALVAVAGMTWEGPGPLILAALAPLIQAAPTAWRADPQWPDCAIGDDARRSLIWGMAVLSGSLRAHPAALRDAAAVVLRDGDPWGVSLCLNALGAAGWRALADDQRAALLQNAPADALGRVWSALDDAQREATTQRAEATPNVAADCIGRIGAAAWRATDPALRRRLIAAVARDPLWVFVTAPAWSGMTDDERNALTTSVIERGDVRDAFLFLHRLGVAGRATLTAAQRAVLDARVMESDSWRVLALRAADAGWTALSDEERDAALMAMERSPWAVRSALRAVGAAGWRAMRADERKRLAAIVRRTPDGLFFCPPALWRDLADGRLPPATDSPTHATTSWRAEDADADLGDLPPAHQALVLALAPWRPAPIAPDSARIRRLFAAWDAMTTDDRVAVSKKHPSVLATIAAAARLHGAAGVLDAVGATVARVVTATGGADGKRTVAAMLGASVRWRRWMGAFAPTDADPPDVREMWRAAAQRGGIADLALCARLAARRWRGIMMPATTRRLKRPLGAVDGPAAALAQVVEGALNERAALLSPRARADDESPPAPPPVVADAPCAPSSTPPIRAAPAMRLMPDLAAWRADPQRSKRNLGDNGIRRTGGDRVVAAFVCALRDRSAALRAAVAIVRRTGDSIAVVLCFRSLGSPDRRPLRLRMGSPDEAQRAHAQAASSRPSIAARLIGRIGAPRGTRPTRRGGAPDRRRAFPEWDSRSGARVGGHDRRRTRPLGAGGDCAQRCSGRLHPA